MWNERWVWPEVRDAGTSGAGAVPLRSAQMMGQQKQQQQQQQKNSYIALYPVKGYELAAHFCPICNYLSTYVGCNRLFISVSSRQPTWDVTDCSFLSPVVNLRGM